MRVWKIASFEHCKSTKIIANTAQAKVNVKSPKMS